MALGSGSFFLGRAYGTCSPGPAMCRAEWASSGFGRPDRYERAHAAGPAVPRWRMEFWKPPSAGGGFAAWQKTRSPLARAWLSACLLMYRGVRPEPAGG